MRYLVKARVKPGRQKALLDAIAQGTLGEGSIAGDEYLHDMQQARAGEVIVCGGAIIDWHAPSAKLSRNAVA